MLDEESHLSRQLLCTVPSVPVQPHGDSKLSPFAPSWQIRQKGPSLGKKMGHMSNNQALCLCLLHYSLDCKPLSKLLFVLQHPAPNVLSFEKPSQTPIGGVVYSFPRVLAAPFYTCLPNIHSFSCNTMLVFLGNGPALNSCSSRTRAELMVPLMTSGLTNQNTAHSWPQGQLRSCVMQSEPQGINC